MRLRSKVALVTGGARGIGLATAELFAEEGATVIVGVRDVDAAGSKGDVEFAPLDVTNRDRWEALTQDIVDRHGHLDVLVNNAVPPVKRAPVSRPAPKLGAYRAVIDEWLLADRDAPPKQRHTARRIWQRLVDGARC